MLRDDHRRSEGSLRRSGVHAQSTRDVDVRLGVRVLNPRVYVGVGYLWASNNYGYPNMNGSGSASKSCPISTSRSRSSAASGTIRTSTERYDTGTAGSEFRRSPSDLGHNILKYQAGITISIPNMPLFFEAGWIGDSWTNKQNAPSTGPIMVPSLASG